MASSTSYSVLNVRYQFLELVSNVQLCYLSVVRYKGGCCMTRLELLALLYSIEALLDEDRAERAKEVVKKVIAEAEKS